MLFKKKKTYTITYIIHFQNNRAKEKSLLFFVTEVQQFVVFNAIPSNNWRQIILEVINISLPLSHRFTGQEKSDLEKPRNHSCCLSPIWQKMHFFPHLVPIWLSTVCISFCLTVYQPFRPIPFWFIPCQWCPDSVLQDIWSGSEIFP